MAFPGHGKLDVEDGRMSVTTHLVAQANRVPVDLPIKEVNTVSVVIPVWKLGADTDAALGLPLNVAKERY